MLKAGKHSFVCGRCGDLKLPNWPCETCADLAKERKECPELTTAHNWSLRSPKSKRKSYLAKRKKQLFARLSKLDSNFNFLQWQKQWKLVDTEIINKATSRLSDKREKTWQKYMSVEKELQSIKNDLQVNKRPEDKQLKDRNEATIEKLRTLLSGIKKMVELN